MWGNCHSESKKGLSKIGLVVRWIFILSLLLRKAVSFAHIEEVVAYLIYTLRKYSRARQRERKVHIDE